MSSPFNAAVYLSARGRADRPALVEGETSLSYGELAERVGAASGGWRGLGVRPEERVLIHSADRADAVVALLSLLRIGAVPVLASTMVSGTELAALIRDCRCRKLLTGPEFADRAAGALGCGELPDLDTVVVLDDASVHPRPPVARVGWERLLAAGGDGAPDRTTEDSPALWLYTSGTTGVPKAAMHRHGSIRTVAEGYGREVLGLRADDRCLSVARLFSAYGLGNSCLLPLAAGAAAVLDPAPPTPAGLARLLARHEPTVFFGVPTSYAALLHAPGIPDDAFRTVRLAVSAGEPLPPELQHRFLSRFGADLTDGLGTTEALHVFLSQRPGRTRPGTLGTPVPGYELRIDAPDGTEVAPGKSGVLKVRAPSAATGYWCRTPETRAMFQGEWLNTGDVFTRDRDGQYRCHGRANDMIKSGGYWVAPTEVEHHLLQHPDVGAVCVVAAPDADGLDRPVACVVPAGRELPDEAALLDFCRATLSGPKRPRHILLFTALPTNGTGKVDRRGVREEARARLREEASTR